MLYKDYINNRLQYQEQSVELLLSKKHACLFFEPGKGKTYPTIDAIREVDKQKNGKANVLIISTCDAIRKMWNVEIVPQKILPENTFLVTDRTAIGKTSEALLEMQWDVIVVDECHIIKAHNSKIHKLVYKLTRNTEYVFGLTGTPRGNTDIDIWCQLQALRVGNQGRMSYTAWTQAYCEFETGWGPYGQFKTPVKIKDKYQTWWNQLLDEYCMFVNYDEEDDMPELNIKTVDVEYKKTKEYEDAYKGIIEVGEFATTTTKMVAINKAHQACNGYLYLPDKTVHRIEKNRKLDALKDILHIGERAVIVYKHIADYDDLKAEFGVLATDDVATFKKGKHQILLLQCGCCQSFNLQDYCSTIIFYTLDYSFIKYKQMLHRCWRKGQAKPVDIIVLLQKDTVEKQIWAAVTEKQKIHDLYMSITRSC